MTARVLWPCAFAVSLLAVALCFAAIFTPWPMQLTLMALGIALFVVIPLATWASMARD